MQERPNHLIEKLGFEIHVEGVDSPTAFLSSATDFIQSQLSSAIEVALESLALHDKLIVIEKLEVDLKEIDWNNRDLLIERLKTELLRQLKFPIVSQSHNTLQHHTKNSDTTAKNLSKNEQRAERWSHFLHYGSLPWWDQSGASITFSLKEDLIQFIKEDGNGFVQLFKKFLKDKFVFQQVIRRLSELLKEEMIQLIFGSLKSENKIPEFTELIKLKSLINEIRTISTNEFSQHVWWVYFSNKTNKTSVSDIEQLSLELQFSPEQLWKLLLAELQERSTEFAIIQKNILNQWNSESQKISFIKSILPNWYQNARQTAEALEKLSSIKTPQWILFLFESQQKNKGLHRWLLDLDFKLKESKTQLSILVNDQIRSLLELFFELNQKNSFQTNKIHPSISAKLSAISQEDFEILKGTADKDHYDWLLRYLKTGSLPWLQRQFTQEDIEALIKEMYAQNEAYFIQYFQKVDLYRYPQVWERVEKQFSPDIIALFSQSLQVQVFQTKRKDKLHRETILQLLFTKGLIPWYDVLDSNEDRVLEIIISFYKEDPVFFRRAIAESQIANKPTLKEKIRFLLGERILKFIEEHGEPDALLESKNTAPEKNLKLEDLLNDFHELTFQLEYYFKHERFTEQVKLEFKNIIQAIIRINTSEARLLITAFYQRFPEKILNVLSKEDQQILQTWINDETETLEEQEEIELPEFLKPKQSREKTEADKLMPEGTVLYIRNAGLVLLHPFINRFFSMLKLVEKRKFISEEAKEKAVHILQYLIFEKSDMPEFELTLNKILCGIPPVMPVKSSVLLSPEEHDLSISLLKGVIENWAILKNSSVENLRASFLLRDGKLTKEPDGWRLRVEQKGFDVLLKQIPWSYSTVKLPWMNEVIHVDWN
jgi:hypothetical protein